MLVWLIVVICVSSFMAMLSRLVSAESAEEQARAQKVIAGVSSTVVWVQIPPVHLPGRSSRKGAKNLGFLL